MASDQIIWDETNLCSKRSGVGDSFTSIATELFGDPRVACLLQDLNPQLHVQGALLRPGQTLRVPHRSGVQRWAAQLGLTLGFDPCSSLGTGARRRWQTFSPPERHPPPPTEFADLLHSRWFADCCARFESSPEQERDLTAWQLLTKIEEKSFVRFAGSTTLSRLMTTTSDAGVGIIEAAVNHATTKVLIDTCRKTLAGAAQLIEVTLRDSLGAARLWLAIHSLPRVRRRMILIAMGIEPTQINSALECLAQLETARQRVRHFVSAPLSQRKVIERLTTEMTPPPDLSELNDWMDRAPRSPAARDCLTVALAGLSRHTAVLVASLKPLAGAFRTLAKQLAGALDQGAPSGQLLDLAHAIAFIPDMARRELEVTHGESLTAVQLHHLAQATRDLTGSPLALAARLPGLVGERLLATDVATLEGGLATVIAEQAAPSHRAEVTMNAAALLSRIAAGEAAKSLRQAELTALSDTAARLALTAVGTGTPRVAGVGMRRRQLEREFDHLFLAGANATLAISSGAIEEMVLDQLAAVTGDNLGLADHRAREHKINRTLGRNRKLFVELLDRLKHHLPVCGHNYLSATGLALLISAHLLHHAHNLRDQVDIVERLTRLVVDAADSVISRCRCIFLERQLS